MHKLTFYPLGNADCCKVDLSNGRKLLFDFASYPEVERNSQFDLVKVLREDLASASRDDFDVVAFTHADDDHIRGCTEFFQFEHAKKYQGADRIRIKELWVPAAVLVDTSLEGEGQVLQAEARHRLRRGSGIRAFSRPQRLEDWLGKQGLRLEERIALITGAGELVPGFSKSADGVEFFIHSPFALRGHEGLVDRNESALILQATFFSDDQQTRFLLIGDSTCDVLADVVKVTRSHNRDDRLVWDVFDIPHHCSYLALSNEKGGDVTQPIDEVQWLLNQGCSRGILVSCSDAIPASGDSTLPPHRQAANAYKKVADEIGGDFRVTMEHPSASKPEGMEITIDKSKATVKKTILGGGGPAIIRSAPRAGSDTSAA